MQGHGKLSTMPYMAADPATRPLHDKIVDVDGKPRTYGNIRIVAFIAAAAVGDSDQRNFGRIPSGRASLDLRPFDGARIEGSASGERNNRAVPRNMDGG